MTVFTSAKLLDIGCKS